MQNKRLILIFDITIFLHFGFTNTIFADRLNMNTRVNIIKKRLPYSFCLNRQNMTDLIRSRTKYLLENYRC